eukprot:4574627-Amphidinium_carterae.1
MYSGQNSLLRAATCSPIKSFVATECRSVDAGVITVPSVLPFLVASRAGAGLFRNQEACAS